MITNENINSIIEECSKNGHKVRVRDISYIILCEHFEDSEVAYKSIFGDATETEIYYYERNESILYLRNYMKVKDILGNKQSSSSTNITFEENKAYMLKLKADTEKAIADGEIEKKDGLKILADLSVKLNDKFNISETNNEQLVIVNQKYTDICEYCGREIAPRPISKEEAKKMYNLIDNK